MTPVHVMNVYEMHREKIFHGILVNERKQGDEMKQLMKV